MTRFAIQKIIENCICFEQDDSILKDFLFQVNFSSNWAWFLTQNPATVHYITNFFKLGVKYRLHFLFMAKNWARHFFNKNVNVSVDRTYL